MAAKRLKPKRRVVLVIVDGFGINSNKENNAIYVARTPCMDALFARHPHTVLEASGTAVGLPAGQIGNSEVGHIIIGCGNIIEHDLTRINHAIDDQSFFKNPVLLQTIKQAKANQRPLHLLGLVSSGGVHSHVNHLLALIAMCQQHQVAPWLHMISDGRDTPPREVLEYRRLVEPMLQAAGGRIVTLMGRYYAMDRDCRWERTELAWHAMALAHGKTYPNFEAAVYDAYQTAGDEFIKPCVLADRWRLDEKDHLILFNFRNDRPRQLIDALSLPDFDHFSRGTWRPIHVTTLTEINKHLPCRVAFAPLRPQTSLARILSEKGLRQFHCAETEKYPHITFYFNGGNEKPMPGESRTLIPSPKVSTYDLQPEMSAPQVTAAVVDALAHGDYDFMVVNYANTDMVGHTAVPDPIITAVETVDEQLGRIAAAVREHNWTMVLTADHGNCDEMVDPKTKQPNTQHTLSPVPFLIANERHYKLAEGQNISSITPTILDLMGLHKPASIKGQSLIVSESDMPERQMPQANSRYWVCQQ